MRKIINIKNFITIAILGFGLFYLSSCSKPDTAPQLELTVENMDGQPVSHVLVGLFDALDQWSMLENPVQVWRETDQNGKVIFINLEEQEYYFYADGDTLSNIGHEIKLTEVLRINEIRQITVIIE